MRWPLLVVVSMPACIVEPSLFVKRSGDGDGVIVSDPAGIDCGPASEACGMVVEPAGLTLIATPATSSEFVGWEGGGCSGTDACVPVLDGTTTIAAHFQYVARELTINVLGRGSVTSLRAGFVCQEQCTHELGLGTTETLRAAPAETNMFVGWEGAPACGSDVECTVEIDTDRVIVARFAPIPRASQVLVTKYGTGTGRVVSTPAGIDCPGDCSEYFGEGSAVTLTATPTTDSLFGHWDVQNGPTDVTTESVTFTVTGYTFVKAIFNRKPM